MSESKYLGTIFAGRSPLDYVYDTSAYLTRIATTLGATTSKIKHDSMVSLSCTQFSRYTEKERALCDFCL